MLYKPLKYSYIYKKPAFNVSAAIWCFKYGKAIEIRDAMIFDFYRRLSHISNLIFLSLQIIGLAHLICVSCAKAYSVLYMNSETVLLPSLQALVLVTVTVIQRVWKPCYKNRNTKEI